MSVRYSECWQCPECSAQLWVADPAPTIPTCHLGHAERPMARQTVQHHRALDSNGHTEINGENEAKAGW